MYGKGTSHCRAGFLPRASEAYGWALKGILEEPAEISEYVQHVYSYVLHCNSLVFFQRAAGRILVGCKGEPLNLVLEEVEKG